MPETTAQAFCGVEYGERNGACQVTTITGGMTFRAARVSLSGVA